MNMEKYRKSNVGGVAHLVGKILAVGITVFISGMVYLVSETHLHNIDHPEAYVGLNLEITGEAKVLVKVARVEHRLNVFWNNLYAKVTDSSGKVLSPEIKAYKVDGTYRGVISPTNIVTVDSTGPLSGGEYFVFNYCTSYQFGQFELFESRGTLGYVIIP